MHFHTMQKPLFIMFDNEEQVKEGPRNFNTGVQD